MHMNDINKIIKETEKSERIKNIISDSCLLEFINSYINKTSILEINKKEEIYNNIFDCIKLIHNTAILKPILYDSNTNLSNILKELYNSVLTYKKTIGGQKK